MRIYVARSGMDSVSKALLEAGHEVHRQRITVVGGLWHTVSGRQWLEGMMTGPAQPDSHFEMDELERAEALLLVVEPEYQHPDAIVAFGFALGRGIPTAVQFVYPDQVVRMVSDFCAMAGEVILGGGAKSVEWAKRIEANLRLEEEARQAVADAGG